MLWLTDRSRYVAGLANCQAYRYYSYHYNGYGITRKRSSIPLATGVYVHEGIASLLALYVRTGKISRESARGLIANTVDTYQQEVLKAGEMVKVEAEDFDHTVSEQSCLIAGILWAFYQMYLPLLLADFDIISIETEESYVVECDCGAGDNTMMEAHEETCNGIVWMSRLDLIVRRKLDKLLYYIDYKTVGYKSDGWEAQWADNLQMAVSPIGTEIRLGEKVVGYYVLGIQKGQRSSQFGEFSRSYDGPKRQNSVLCYAYYKHGSPPLDYGDWQPKFKYVGEDGKNHTLGKHYTKTAIWDGYFHEKPAEMSNIEYWVSVLPPQILLDLFITLGPYQKHEFLIKTFLSEMPREEVMWRHKLYESNNGEASVVRSWNCHQFGGPCTYLPICYQHPGWEDKYTGRMPHHTPEITQLESRGLVISKDAAEVEPE